MSWFYFLTTSSSKVFQLQSPGEEVDHATQSPREGEEVHRGSDVSWPAVFLLQWRSPLNSPLCCINSIDVHFMLSPGPIMFFWSSLQRLCFVKFLLCSSCLRNWDSGFCGWGRGGSLMSLNFLFFFFSCLHFLSHLPFVIFFKNSVHRGFLKTLLNFPIFTPSNPPVSLV